MSQLALCFDNVVGTQKRYVSQTCRVHHHNLDAALKPYGFTEGMLKVVNQLAYNLKTPKVISIQILAEKSLTSESTVKRALKKLKEIGFLKVENQGFKKPSKLIFCWQLFIEFLEKLKISITGKLRDHLLYWQQKLSAKTDSAKNATSEKTLFSDPAESPALPTLASDCTIGQNEPHLKINNIKLFMHTAAKNFFSNLDFSNFRNISQSNQKTDTSKNPITPLDIFLTDMERILQIHRPKKTNQVCGHFKAVYINNFKTNTDVMRLYLEHITKIPVAMEEIAGRDETDIALKVIDFDFMKTVQIRTDYNDPDRKIKFYNHDGKMQIVAMDFTIAAPKTPTPSKVSAESETSEIARNTQIASDRVVKTMEKVKLYKENLDELESKNFGQFIWGLLEKVKFFPGSATCLKAAKWDKENCRIVLFVEKSESRFYKDVLIGASAAKPDVDTFINNHPLIKNNGLSVIWKDQE